MKAHIVLWNGLQVRPRGMGEKKAQALDAWRSGVAFQAQLTQPGTLPQAQANAISDKYAQQTRPLENAQHAARARATEQQAELRQKWARTQAHIAEGLNDSTTRFARLHAEKDPELAAARQQSETANWQRDFAKRELDRYRHITYPRYLRRLVTG
jgi:hypothetical protein